jgi:hypothetical protein
MTNSANTCMFATPSKHTLVFDEKRLTPLIEAYKLLDDVSSDDGLSSPDKDVSGNQGWKKIEERTGSVVSAPIQKDTTKSVVLVPSKKGVVLSPKDISLRTDLPIIGTIDVARWVTKSDLIAMGHTEQDVGLWIDGLICEVRKKTGRRASPGEVEYDITFELPPLCTHGDHVNKWY